MKGYKGKISADKAKRIVGKKSQLNKELYKLYGAINSYAKVGMDQLETAYDKRNYAREDIDQLATRLEADGYRIALDETPEWHILRIYWLER